jgi:hypothetical protein
MSKEDIYGKDPDGGAKAAGEQALRKMASLGITDKAEKCTGEDASSSKDIPKAKGCNN